MTMFYLVAIVLLPVISFFCCLVPFYPVFKASKNYLILLGVLSLIFLYPLLGNTTIIQKDANLLQVPFFMSYRDSIRSFGQLPLWTPYFWTGMVNLAHPLSHVFHPTAFLSLLLPVYQAFNLSCALMIFFSAAFMFILVTELGQSHKTALVSAVVYAFNEFTLDRLWAINGPGIEYIYSYAVLPLSIALLLRACKTKSYAYAGLFGLSLVFLMNGNPNLLYYSMLLYAIVLAYAIIRSSSRKHIGFKVSVLLVGVVILLLANAVELIPFLEMQNHIDGTRLHSEVSGWRMSEISWAQVPDLFAPNKERLHWPYATRVGWVALVLAGLSLVQRKNKHIVLLMIALMGFGILLLTHSWLFTALWSYVPLFKRMSMIPSVFIFFTLPLAVLAGIGSDIPVRKNHTQILIALGIFFEIVAVANAWIHYPQFPKISTFNYTEELADFPHLAALNPNRTLEPYRIECRSSLYRLLCPEYAVMHYRLRILDGDHYLYPTTWVEEDILSHPSKNNLLDVKYILSLETLDEPGFILKDKLNWKTANAHRESGFYEEMKRFIASSAWDGTVYIYEADQTAHAFMIDEEASEETLPSTLNPFKVTHFSPMRITIEGQTSKSGTLLVSEPYYPGWKAKVNGTNVDIKQLDNRFIGVPLPTGIHNVVVYYSPISFILGFWISFVTIVFTILSTRPMRLARQTESLIRNHVKGD